MFNVTTGKEGIHHFNFTGLVRERELTRTANNCSRLYISDGIITAIFE
jgi:hypothetical protein